MELTVKGVPLEIYIQQRVSDEVAKARAELFEEISSEANVENSHCKYKDDDYLNTHQIAELYGISPQTVYRRKKEMAMFPKFRGGVFLDGTRIRFKELEEFMQYVHTPEYRQELKKLKAVIR